MLLLMHPGAEKRKGIHLEMITLVTRLIHKNLENR